MNKGNLKYYVGIILILFVDSLHNIFFENNERFDVYLFYDHERYFTNILYDISHLFKFSILTYWLIDLNKRVFKPLFLVSLIIWILYFLFYNQKESVIIIPFYISLVLYYNRNIFNK